MVASTKGLRTSIQSAMGTKTIIITALPPKALPIRNQLMPKRSLVEAGLPSVPRKRERLTHLTAEEKLNRRKLKNRIAAQTARDRKKVKMSQLETTTEAMQAENDALADENDALRERNLELEAERDRLAQELEALRAEKGAAFESAAFISAPLQREQAALPPTPILIQLLTTLLTLSSPSSSPTGSLKTLPQAMLEESLCALHKGLPLSPPQLQQLADLWRRARKK